MAFYSADRVLTSADVAAAGTRDRFGRTSSCTALHVPVLLRRDDGSVDVRAMRAGDTGRPEPTKPRGELENAIAGVWQDALDSQGLSVHDNFFDLGGTSFLAGQIAGRLRAVLGLEIVSTHMFQFPTIAAQAAFLAGENDVRQEAVVASRSRGAARREALKRGLRGRGNTPDAE
jgi:hypothetical protein